MKQVVQTNKCIISLMKKETDMITSVIDNLVKWWSGCSKHEFNVWVRWNHRITFETERILKKLKDWRIKKFKKSV
jgi:N-acetyl-gamma-glutamylphosphate reductase